MIIPVRKSLFVSCYCEVTSCLLVVVMSLTLMLLVVMSPVAAGDKNCRWAAVMGNFYLLDLISCILVPLGATTTLHLQGLDKLTLHIQTYFMAIPPAIAI